MSESTKPTTPSNQYGELLGHNYDGIQEYDNPTPGWWHGIFMACTAFAVLYLFWAEFSPLSTSAIQRHRAAQQAEFKLLFADLGVLTADEKTLLTLVDDPKWYQIAQGIFVGNCASCHAPDGKGLVGPNLTDEAYKTVKTITDIAKVIENGAASGAMPAWKTRLMGNEIVLVASLVANMRGQNLPGGRGAEGEVIPPWPDLGGAPGDSPDEPADAADDEAASPTRGSEG